MLNIAIDIDDTLNNLMQVWLLHYNLQRGTLFKFEDLKVNPPHEILGITKKDYINNLDKFKINYYNKVIVNKKFWWWFDINGTKANFIAITSTSMETVSESSKWLFNCFGEWIRNYVVIPNHTDKYHEYKYFQSKAQWMDWFGKVDIYIDDNEKSIKQVNEICPKVKTICIKQPWNSGLETKRVLEILDKEILQHDNNQTI